MKKQILIFLSLSAILTCCVPSVHPLYTAKDLIEDDRILGIWAQKDSPDSWQFERSRGEEKTYLLTMTDSEERKFYFNAHLVKLQDQLYLDFSPARIMESSSDNFFPEAFHAQHLLGVHTFAKMGIENQQINIQFFDPDWVENLIKKSKIRIKHEKVNDTYLLTAGTQELQQFILKYGKEKAAFAENAFLERKI